MAGAIGGRHRRHRYDVDRLYVSDIHPMALFGRAERAHGAGACSVQRVCHYDLRQLCACEFDRSRRGSAQLGNYASSPFFL